MIQPYKDACFAELKIDQATIDTAQKQYFEEGKTEFGEEISCFSACMFKQLGFMTEEGKFDEDMVRALTADQFSESVLDKAINTCKNEVGKNDCETAGKLFSCFLKQGIAVNA
ncbi:general odorant-binding protein 56a-like isoform X2 [Phymastichus coffea]|nr:general odorant-binding protein 56a-like isoform X2 [Phymastichus coffea]